MSRTKVPFEIREAFATCPPGLEDILAAELRGLGVAQVQPVHGGVPFAADWTRMARSNLELRSALRVLVPLRRGTVLNKDELYRFCGEIDWLRHFRSGQTLAVQSTTSETPELTHAVYISQVVKDAIVDQLRRRTGRRPDVELEDPDVPVFFHLRRGRATLSLDSSGRSLHRRGYREVQVRSPLNEALAAGILLATGWDGTSPLLDPMCGSGTFPIEAALLATRTAPGLLRPRFAFQRWPDFPARQWDGVLAAARRQVVRDGIPPLAGADLHAGAVGIARLALAASGMERHVHLGLTGLADHHPTVRPALVICNPPYGERLGEEAELAEVYHQLGAFLRRECAGATAYVLSGNANLTRHLELKASGKRVLHNGGLECRLLKYEIRSRG